MEPTTRWSQLDRLHETEATVAWQWFIDRYRAFVRAALRRLIWSPERAASAADEFWGYLFTHNAVARLDRSVRFRAFLSGTLRNYAADWQRRNPVAPSVDGPEGAETNVVLPEDEEVALWARQVVHLALDRVAAQSPKGADALRWFYGLPESPDGEPMPRLRATEVAERLGCEANALHQMLHRARGRLRDCMVDEVRQTVGTRDELDDELALLVEAIGRVAPGVVVPDEASERG